MKFDHLAIACQTLAEGVAYVEAALGTRLPPAIGHHALMGTQNRLLSLGGAEYLEVIAIDPDATRPPFPRWFGLDGFSGPPKVVAWIAAMEAGLGPLERQLLPGAGRVLNFQRGDYLWQMAVPESGLQPFDGLQPAQILWQSRQPALDLPPSPCRLNRLILEGPEVEALSPRLAAFTDPRLSLIQGAGPRICAEILTPEGLRLLT